MRDALPPVDAAQRLAHSQESAPVGFRFPASFGQLITGEDLPDLDPIVFLAADEPEALAAWTRILAGQFPARVLVPFAKDESSDDVFCFDGRDLSGQPPVLLIHSFTTPGWEFRGEWKDFDVWLRAILDALEIRRRDEGAI